MVEQESTTSILKVSEHKIGHVIFENEANGYLGNWSIEVEKKDDDFAALQIAAKALQDTDGPVAIPTETVYGLAADATRSRAVQGIFRAKGRPSDNPLIVHVASLLQLRSILDPAYEAGISEDPIPSIYLPLIQRFWPGPLTIICPIRSDSAIAREVSAGLDTVGFRIPASPVALFLIKLAGRPLAAPSANTSSRPSSTLASHVFEDFRNRIQLIVDGGPCTIGIESTIVNGLGPRTTILRPGHIHHEDIRRTSGWEDTQLSYLYPTDTGPPEAPGMKYKHYAPWAPLHYMERGMYERQINKYAISGISLGILWTRGYSKTANSEELTPLSFNIKHKEHMQNSIGEGSQVFFDHFSAPYSANGVDIRSLHVVLGPSMKDLEQKLFSALRFFDSHGVSRIFVQAIELQDQDSAAAVINRIRKASTNVELD